MEYILLFFLFLVLELVYFKIADKFNIIDKPNSRSSHTSITLRGGGVIFPIAIITACFLGYVSWELTLAATLVAAISFIDDINPLSQLPRLFTHVVAVGLIFYDLDLFSELMIWFIPIVFLLFIAWINAFNFMDGINGITVLYALTAIASFSLLRVHQVNLPVLITVGLSCVVFAIFNVRKKAKTFAGDVGSISVALFLGYFMIKTIIETQQFGYILFFSVYGIDTFFTILYRIKRKENILQPHRSHLYQYLANEMKIPHVAVSLIYALLQLVINIVLIYMDSSHLLTMLFSIILVVFLSLFYLLIRMFVIRRINHSTLTI